MSKYAILGYPLKHTMSPPIHKRLFELSGVSGFEYEICEFSPEELAEKGEYLNALAGYNITIPYKVEIINLCDELDESAKRYTSVNCIANKNGKHIGYNTDCDGFLRTLEAGGANLSGNVLQLGCGGVGRMMAIEAVRHGAKLTISVLPDFENTAEPVLEYAQKYYPNAEITVTTADKISGKFDLLVNSTPVGMYPNVESCPISDEVIRSCECVFDAIYNPVETLLMKKARSFGKKAIGGMAMLVWQAVVAHEIWDGSKYNEGDITQIITDMESAVMRDFK